jgi:CBS domain containing-hemolysin-like protein
MLLLIIYVLIALVFSFLCSIAEAVILSVRASYVALLEQEGKHSGVLLRELRENLNRPLAAILTLNTIAHTVGAAGAGAQAAAVFGNAWLGLTSAVLTLLILVFSEIIPKSLGAHYWRSLAPATAYGLNWLVKILYPFVLMAEKLTGNLTGEPTLIGFSRNEFAAIADISMEEGQLGEQESRILKNLMLLRETLVTDAMTPRTVVFSLRDSMKVGECFHKHDHIRFSRIPLYEDNPDHISGFVLRDDMLLAQARGNTDVPLSNYRRELLAVLDTTSLSDAFEQFLQHRQHIMLVVDEYGSAKGILTLEDLLETLLGLEIVDEEDKTVDMQQLARSLWRRRAREMGLEQDGQQKDEP